MAITNFDKVFTINGKEYGFVAVDTPYTSRIIEMEIPKITGALSTGNSTTTVNLNSVLQNSPECKIAFNNTIKFKKSIPVTVRPSTNLGGYATGGILKKGTKIVVNFINGNIRSAYI